MSAARLSVAVLAVALTSSVLAVAWAQTASFEGTGQAPIANGDKVRARTRALDEALRQAVAAAAASLFDGAVPPARQSSLRLVVEPKARTYVTGYRLLDESAEGGVFRVHLTADVALDGLERDLGAAQPGPPPRATATRIGLCVADRSASDGGSSDAAAEVGERVAAIVTAAGATVEPLAAPCDARAPPPPTPPVATGVNAGAAPGESTPVDPVVAGQHVARARLDGAIAGQIAVSGAGPVRGTPMSSARARLRLDLIDARGRSLLSTLVEEETYGASEPEAVRSAVRRATDTAAPALRRAIDERWLRPPALTVRLEPFERYAHLVALERALAAIPGVAAVEARRFTTLAVEIAVRGGTDATTVMAALARPSAAPGLRFVARMRDDRTLTVQAVAVAPAGAAPMPAPEVPR